MEKKTLPPLGPEPQDYATWRTVQGNKAIPPLVAEIAGGSVTWQALEQLDYEFLGYFLCCHLIIEHYLDEFLKSSYPSLSWEKARHTFGQKVALLSQFKPKYDCIPPIKHLNTLRNKLIHNINLKIEVEDLLPLTQYLSTIVDEYPEPLLKDHPKVILERFTVAICALFGGAISFNAQFKTRSKPKP